MTRDSAIAAQAVQADYGESLKVKSLYMRLKPLGFAWLKEGELCVD